MGVYTIYENRRIDVSIGDTLSLVTRRILTLIDPENIRAIILTGSFGRGEGGVYLEGEQIRLINDLDLTIITRPRSYKTIIRSQKRKIEKLAEELAAEINIKQIDLGVSHPRRFMLMSNTVNFYEVASAFKILYGDFRMRRKFNPRNLSTLDGAMFFLTRGSGLLIPLLLFMKKNITNTLFRETILIEINKGKLAMGDAYLLLKRHYHYSFQERMVRAEKLAFDDVPGGNRVKELYLEALQWKLEPDLTWQGKEKVLAEWNRVIDLFSGFFLWHENKRLDRNFENWTEYMENIYSNQPEFGNTRLKRLIKAVLLNPRGMLNKDFRKQTILKTFPAKLSILPGILFSQSGQDSDKMLETSNANFQKFFHGGDHHERIELAMHYLRVFHPGGVVGLISQEK